MLKTDCFAKFFSKSSIHNIPDRYRMSLSDIITKNVLIIFAYNQKTNYNVRIIIKYRNNICAHNLKERGNRYGKKAFQYAAYNAWDRQCAGNRML